MKAGTTPLIIHVPEMAPIRKRIRIADATSPTFPAIAFSNSFHGVLYRHIDNATHTPAATRSATWDAPRMESDPKMEMSRASRAIRTTRGMNAMMVRFISDR